MKIAKIWNNDYPWDVRVEKICKALIGDEHQVHLICRNLRQEQTREIIDGINVHRLPPIKFKMLNNICSIVAFFNPFWLYFIHKVVKKETIDIILVRDLPLVLSALFIGRIHGIPVVFDMAENFPSMWRDHVDKRGIKCINHILKNPHVATWMENYVIRRVDRIIVVVEESKHRLVNKGVEAHNISIVSNTPDLQTFSDDLGVNCEHSSNTFQVLYVGYVNGGRGLDTAIKAVPMIKDTIENFSLVIAGGGEYLDELKDLVRNIGVEQQVSFLGWVSSSLVPSYINASDVCIVPHDVTEFINTTVPNKIFDYMAGKKPIVVSNATPLERIVNEAKCGLVFKSKISEDFARKIVQLKDSSVRQKMGENGYDLVHTKYNWHNDSQTLKSIFR